MRLPKMTTRRWLIVIVSVVLDLTVIVQGPLAWAIAALTLTVVASVVGAIVMLNRWENEGPGKTLY